MVSLDIKPRHPSLLHQTGGILPSSKALRTSAYPAKGLWTVDNLPEVLFYLQPKPNPNHHVKPETRIRDDGVTIRHFEILPDYLSVDVEGKYQSALEA
jgi:hypothetical protein